jgi:DNA polymerase-3 subunit epsilon
MKLFFFDLETTGVKYWRNSIHHISGDIVINDELKQSFNYRVQPYHKADIEDAALEVSGTKREDLKEFARFEDVYSDIVAMLGQYVNKFDKKDKFHLVGYNIKGFDTEFVRAFFLQNNDQFFGSWFWSVPIDVIVLAQTMLMPVRHTMKDFKLHSVASKLGITVNDKRLHDAAYDNHLTREIYKKVVTPYVPLWELQKNGFGFDAT